MRLMLVTAALTAIACLTPTAGEALTPATCAGPYRLEVVDEAGRALPTFTHHARSYLLGTLGQRYLLRLHNDGARRVEVVVSVDGRDAVDGGPAAWEKRGYLVDAGGEVTIEGFRVSTDAVAAFRFSSVRRSYAALQGDARDVGVIGVAVFAERERPRVALPVPDRAQRSNTVPDAPGAVSSDAGAPSAPRAESGMAQRQGAGRAAERPGLGTEFGEERESRVRLVSFERASSRPNELLTVRYDDRDGLIAAGVDVDATRWAQHLRDNAEPFRHDADFARPPPGWRPHR